jgi:hypothetical protein
MYAAMGIIVVTTNIGTYMHERACLAEQDHREEKKEGDDEDEDKDGEDRYYFCRHGGRVTEYNLSKGDKEEISRVPVPVEPGNPVLVKVIHASHLLSSRYSTVVSVRHFSSHFSVRLISWLKYNGAFLLVRACRRSSPAGTWGRPWRGRW